MLAGACAGLSAQEWSDQVGEPGVMLTDMELRIEYARLRLDLSDHQTRAVRQLLRDHVAAHNAILDKHDIIVIGAGRTGQVDQYIEPAYLVADIRTLLALRAELRESDAASAERLADILTPEQRIELESLWNEWEQKARDRGGNLTNRFPRWSAADRRRRNHGDGLRTAPTSLMDCSPAASPARA